MKKIIECFRGMKLNTKFTGMIILFVAVCMAVLSGILFRNMERNVVEQQRVSLEYKMEKNHGQILKNVESVNMSTQIFRNDTGLNHFLNRTKEGEDIPTEELISFYKRDIASLQRMVNSNPYLYQVRVYADSDTMQEMMPILFRRSRMEKLAWAKDASEGWKFGYTDRIFEENGSMQQKSILSFVTVMTDVENGTIGILEVAMEMETMFPGLYEQEDGMFSCFIDEKGKRYDGSGSARAAELMDIILAQNEASENQEAYYTEIDGEKLIVGSMPVKELNGMFVCAQTITGAVGEVFRMRDIFIVAMAALLVALAFLINRIVKGVLRKFYEIIASIREIQNGNLDVVIEDCGKDEMGELGAQINKMMERIRQLMEDNLRRELLAKDSEIRALQNQINAHFIYNVLESIKMMAEIEEKYEISDAITALGRLLRYSMKWVSGNVTVREEIEYIRNYLALINLRFDYEIFLSLNVSEEVMLQEIPKMSLQPIVENAIYHGIEQLAEDTTIYIKGSISGTDCAIEITDAGKGMTEEEVRKLYGRITGEISAGGGSGNGIGLKNVQDRIHMNFGEEYGIEIASRLGCYTKVIVRIPKRHEISETRGEEI